MNTDVIGPVTREGARRAAERELSKPAYHHYDDPWPVRVFDAVVHWIQHVVDRVASHSPGGGAGAAVLVIALVLVLAIVRWRLGPVRRESRQAAPVLTDRTTTAAEHRAAADAAAAAGQWHDAVLARMRALARGLEERGVLDVRAGRTADELALDVAAVQPVHADAVRRAAATFDEVIYGGRRATAVDHDVVRTADDAVHGRRVRAAVT